MPRNHDVRSTPVFRVLVAVLASFCGEGRDIGPGVRSYTVTVRRGATVKFRMRSANGVGAGPWGGWTQTVRVR